MLDLLGSTSRLSERSIKVLRLRPWLINGSMEARPLSIGLWNYSPATEKPAYGHADLAHDATLTTRNPATDFRDHEHPAAKKQDVGGEAG